MQEKKEGRENTGEIERVQISLLPWYSSRDSENQVQKRAEVQNLKYRTKGIKLRKVLLILSSERKDRHKRPCRKKNRHQEERLCYRRVDPSPVDKIRQEKRKKESERRRDDRDTHAIMVSHG